MRRLAIRQLINDFTKVRKTLVDHVSFFEKLTFRACFLNAFTTGQIDQVQLSCLLAERFQVGLLHCDNEASVGAGRARVHVCCTD